MKCKLENRFVLAYATENFNKINPCFEKLYFCQECVVHLCPEGGKMQEIPQMPATTTFGQTS